MKKLLYQFDTDAQPAVFDNVVAYDGGADHVTAYGGVTPGNVGALVDGAIFTRAPKEKKFTAIFVGGSSMAEGEALFAAVRRKFFANFRVSVMLDSNGTNTTAAAGVAWLAHGRSLAGRRAVVLGGTGPVGQRVALLLAREGARVALTSRSVARAQQVAQTLAGRFGIEIEAIEAIDNAARARAVEGAQIVFATGAAGVNLLDEAAWKDAPTLELLCDANATPPLGIAGIDTMDKAVARHGKTVWGAIGFGALKIALHRACIALMFESNERVLDAEEIHRRAKTMIDDLSTSAFLDALAGGSATPGGGSAAAIMGAMGAALVSMVANLTLGKKGYEAVEAPMRELLGESEALRKRLAAMVAEDVAAFDSLMAAYRLPKAGEDEKAARSAAIQAGLKAATEAPLACARLCASVVRLTERAVEHGNLNAISDVGVGALAALAALRGAALNVRINAPQIMDRAFVERAESELDALIAECAPLAERVHERVRAKLGA